MEAKTFFGCSGFHYKDWKGKFYPEGLPEKDWLGYYAEKFQSVEINSSFYHIPKKNTLEKWHQSTPGHFRFTMKGSRYITHQKKLNDVAESVKYFYEVVDTLRGKLGCVLWQLPGNLHLNMDKLKSFCATLSNDYKNVIEFRHISWFTEEVYEVLAKNDIILCMVSAPGNLPEVLEKTAETAYVRFHGKGEWYNYLYTKKELEGWRNNLKKLNVRRIYAYFNNDWNANAPRNCKELKAIF